MSPKNDRHYVTTAECARVSGEIHSEIRELKTILVGEDMRSGISKEILQMSNDLEMVKNYIQTQKSKGRDWRLMGFAILGSVSSGLVIALVTFWLRLLA